MLAPLISCLVAAVLGCGRLPMSHASAAGDTMPAPRFLLAGPMLALGDREQP